MATQDYAQMTGAKKFFADFFGRWGGKAVVDGTREFNLLSFLVLWGESLLIGLPVGGVIDRATNKQGRLHPVSRMLGLKNLSTIFSDYACDGVLDDGFRATEDDKRRGHDFSTSVEQAHDGGEE